MVFEKRISEEVRGDENERQRGLWELLRHQGTAVRRRQRSQQPVRRCEAKLRDWPGMPRRRTPSARRETGYGDGMNLVVPNGGKDSRQRRSPERRTAPRSRWREERANASFRPFEHLSY